MCGGRSTRLRQVASLHGAGAGAIWIDCGGDEQCAGLQRSCETAATEHLSESGLGSAHNADAEGAETQSDGSCLEWAHSAAICTI